MEDNNKIKIILTICVIIIIIIASIIITKNNNFKNIEYNEIIEVSETSNNIVEEIEIIKIHILGEVKYNGIIELNEGARIDDAIKMAGGLTENADISKVNLAYELLDGQKLYIPSINDEKLENYVTEEIEEGIIENIENKNEKININTATQTEMETLPGIGPSIAYKIIQYREQNGKFNSIEELKKVSGIGDNKYKQIEDFVEIK